MSQQSSGTGSFPCRLCAGGARDGQAGAASDPGDGLAGRRLRIAVWRIEPAGRGLARLLPLLRLPSAGTDNATTMRSWS
jgi:hypothetical protein